MIKKEEPIENNMYVKLNIVHFFDIQKNHCQLCYLA